MLDHLDLLLSQAARNIEAAASTDALREAEVHYLGRKGELTQALRGLGSLSAEERPLVGKRANEVRAEMEALLAARKEALSAREEETRRCRNALDVTLPGKRLRHGRRHPLTRALDEIKRIFTGLGFEVVQGPEIETDYYGFQALNYPPDHPAADEAMSFFLKDGVLLRSQTSTVQVRTMEKREPPVRIIAPGRCYRYEAVDATHSHSFTQVEGLFVDEGVSMADLKGTLTLFAREMFGPGVQVRFRPDYFPFVEPGAEIAASCAICKGAGCRVCKMSGWLELGGAGMVHPNVLRNVGYDPEKYTGYAFGMGIERMPMIRYGIEDMRLFTENDIRFLEQF
ncbi:MAG: phenylalanine--tRNA ligase subunit alpha [Armatimonadetes bacterium]|nr:phenylalanine--tRNA ligase subunit alpha [Armatimonadota bacterium]